MVGVCTHACKPVNGENGVGRILCSFDVYVGPIASMKGHPSFGIVHKGMRGCGCQGMW